MGTAGGRAGRVRLWGFVLAVGLAAACRPGTPDEGFGDDGRVVLEADGTDWPGRTSLAATGDGGVVVARELQGTLQRLDAAGEVVPGWERVTPPVPCGRRLDHIAPLGDGALLVCGEATSTATVHDIVVLGADGAPEEGFGTGGVVRFPEPAIGVRAVPLPGGGVLALGGRPFASGVTPAVVAVTLDADGAVRAVEQVPLDAPAPEAGGWPLDSWAIDVTAIGTRAGAAAVVRLDATYSPDPPPLGTQVTLRFDGSGALVGRRPGPVAGAFDAQTVVVDMVETPSGGLAFALEGRQPLDGPYVSVTHVVDVQDEAGAPVAHFPPRLPPGPGTGGDVLRPASVVATPRGDRLLVSGEHWDGTAGRSAVVAAYDTATWELDPDFGQAGVARLDGRVAHDMVPSAGAADRTYVAGNDDADVFVSRLWS